MIRKLLSVSFMAACISASAQITVTQADIASIGTVVKQARDSVPTVMPGPAGANQTWNFSTLMSHEVDTLTFTNPAWTPNAASFPSSNLAVVFSPQFGNPGVSYLNSSPTGLWVLGEGDQSMILDYNPDQLLIPFPATYGTNYTNTYSYTMKQAYTGFPGIDSIMFKETTSKTGNFDGWGNLTTPLGTFATIRSKDLEVMTDSVWIHSTGPFPPAGWTFSQASKDTTYRFGWWANGVGFPLAQIDSSRTGGIMEADWLQASPATTSMAPLTSENGVSLYPNPANSFVNIVIPDNDANALTIYDASGRAVRTVSLSSNYTLISTEDLPAGMYFYVTTGKSVNTSYRGKFTISK